MGGARRFARIRDAAQPPVIASARGIGPGVVSGEELPLARPVIGADEEERVLDVLWSGRLSLGPTLAAFERAFAGHVGAAHASAVSSGTAGLHLALRAVGV